MRAFIALLIVTMTASSAGAQSPGCVVLSQPVQEYADSLTNTFMSISQELNFEKITIYFDSGDVLTAARAVEIAHPIFLEELRKYENVMQSFAYELKQCSQ